MMKNGKKSIRLLSFTISFGLLGLIYFLIDWTKLLEAWQAVNIGWLVVAMLTAFPLILLTVMRLRWLSPSPVSTGLGFYVNLQASAMNLLAPSKLGDIGKAVFLAKHSKLPVQGWVILCMFEKLLDLTALLAWCAGGLLVMPGLPTSFRWLGLGVGALAGFLFVCLLSPALPTRLAPMVRPLLPAIGKNLLDKLVDEWGQVQRLLYKNKQTVPLVVGMSFLIWAGHFGQIYLLGLAANAVLPAGVLLALVPLALVIGLLPLTFAGMGTRDAAFVVLLGSYVSAPAAAVLGMLTTFRYLLPALMGVPLIGRDITDWKKK